MHPLAQLDHEYLWHPFTQMRDWLKSEPIVLVEGRGAILKDVKGREFLDANSSIWTNLHGHCHPGINHAIQQQLSKVAHTSALGFANEPASVLAEQLVLAAENGLRLHPPVAPQKPVTPSSIQPALKKVFFSDDGSTAMEVALKQCYQWARRAKGIAKPKFLSLDGAYHGDTVGAVSLGHIDLFHSAYSGLLFESDKVMAPYCYRCPYNRSSPARADAREYRVCKWECLERVKERFDAQARAGAPYAGFIVEPLMQGAAGMVPQPQGWLNSAAEIARSYGTRLIADEVMTGFGRTGSGSLFACHKEGVQPDFMALAKGLSGGYLPMAATLTTDEVFEAFLGEYSEFKSFFHGHSFTGNQLGSAAGLASLRLLQGHESVAARAEIERTLQAELSMLWRHDAVGDIRQVGLVAGVELVRDWRTREPFDLEERVGIRVCEAMAARGVLTRPIGNVVPLLPPYCSTSAQVQAMVRVLGESIGATLL